MHGSGSTRFGVLTLGEVIDAGECRPVQFTLIPALRHHLKLRSDAPVPLDTRISVGDVALARGGDAAWGVIGSCGHAWEVTDHFRRTLMTALIPCLHRATRLTADYATIAIFAAAEAWTQDGKLVDIDAWVARAREAYLSVPQEHFNHNGRAKSMRPWLTYAAFASLGVAQCPGPVRAAREAARAVSSAFSFVGGNDFLMRERRLQAIDLAMTFPPLIVRPGSRDRLAIQEVKGEMGRRQPLPRPSFTPETHDNVT